MSSSFYRGISADQDPRFKNKQDKLIRSTKFPASFETKVDMRKVEMAVMKPWIAKRIVTLLGFEDDVVIEYLYGLLEDPESPIIDPKNLQILLTGFLESKTAPFMSSLWDLLLSAQSNPLRVPTELLEEKKREMRAREEEQAKMRRGQEHLDEVRARERGGRGLPQQQGGAGGGAGGAFDGRGQAYGNPGPNGLPMRMGNSFDDRGGGGGRGGQGGGRGGRGGSFQGQAGRDSGYGARGGNGGGGGGGYGGRDDRRRGRSPSRSRSPPPRRDAPAASSRRSRSRSRSPPRRRARSPSYSRSRSPPPHTRQRRRSPSRSRSRSPPPAQQQRRRYEDGGRRRSPSPQGRQRRGGRSASPDGRRKESEREGGRKKSRWEETEEGGSLKKEEKDVKEGHESLTRRESELKEGLLRKKVLATRGRRSSNDGAPAAGDEVKEE